MYIQNVPSTFIARVSILSHTPSRENLSCLCVDFVLFFFNSVLEPTMWARSASLFFSFEYVIGQFVVLMHDGRDLEECQVKP